MYFIRARFSKTSEAPSYPLIAHAHKMGITKKERLIEFQTLPSKEQIKEAILRHYQEYNGKVKFFGVIKYYEFYEGSDTQGGKILYTLNINGEIINNHHFKELVSKHFDIPIKELELIERYEERYFEVFNKLLPIVKKKEVILSLVERKNLTVKKIYLALQKHIDKGDDVLWHIAREVFEVYKENGYKFLI